MKEKEEDEENKIRKFAQNRQADREFNYRGHSYPLWIVGVSGPIRGVGGWCTGKYREEIAGA